MRIPLHHHYTRHYVAKLGLQLRQFISVHQTLNCFYDICGIRTRMKDAPQNLYPAFELSDVQRADPIPAAMFDRALKSIVESLTRREQQSLLDPVLTSERLLHLDRTALGEFLRVRAGADAALLIGCSTGLESMFDRASRA